MNLNDFEAFSELYNKQYFEPDWLKFGNVEKSSEAALKLFLHFYAFERQGSSQDYRFISIDVINKINGTIFKEGAVWDLFKEKKKKSLNDKNNPLCPENTNYTWFNKKKKIDNPGKTTKKSIIEIINGASFKQSDGNIVIWAMNKLKDGYVIEAFDELKKINGIGDKISSFFLRDIAVKYQINVAESHRHRLQPIDVWVRFFAKEVLDIETEKQSDEEVAKKICKKLTDYNGINAEKVNQGVWYYSVNFARSSQYLFIKGYENERELAKLIKEQYEACSNSQKMLMQWIDKQPISALQNNEINF